MLAFFRFWGLDTKKQSQSSAYIRNLALSAIIFSLHARSGLKT